jgi:hypothetical protein
VRVLCLPPSLQPRPSPPRYRLLFSLHCCVFSDRSWASSSLNGVGCFTGHYLAFGPHLGGSSLWKPSPLELTQPCTALSRFVKAHTATGRRPRDQAPRFGADHVFGAATPNPEPIDTVISLQAGREWYEIRHAQMLAQRGREELHAKQYKIGQPLTTRTVMLRRKDPSRTRNDDPPPKPSKFDSRAKPAVDSFRSVPWPHFFRGYCCHRLSPLAPFGHNFASCVQMLVRFVCVLTRLRFPL